MSGYQCHTDRRKFIKSSFLLGLSPFFGYNQVPVKNNKEYGVKQKLRPKIASEWWLIGSAPADLFPASHDEIKMLVAHRRRLSERTDRQYDDYGEILTNRLSKIEPVDHHIFKGQDGYWHLWGCVRNTEVGRVLYHWRARDLEESLWEETGEVLRCDYKAGECIDDWYGQEWMQSPYFVEENGIYYMFYGGHSTGFDINGNPVKGNPPSKNMRSVESQICLMTSKNGVNWTRYKNKKGFSRVFVGPGQTRDPCLIKIDSLWYMYYAGHQQDPYNGGIYLRTSRDLTNWSDFRLVHHDGTFGETTWEHECPHVVQRAGYYYLLVTEDYNDARTHVYRSEDPMDFGLTTKESQKIYVGILEAGAPEIYQVDGKEYVSSNHNPPLGTQMARLEWDPV